MLFFDFWFPAYNTQTMNKYYREGSNAAIQLALPKKGWLTSIVQQQQHNNNNNHVVAVINTHCHSLCISVYYTGTKYDSYEIYFITTSYSIIYTTYFVLLVPPCTFSYEYIIVTPHSADFNQSYNKSTAYAVDYTIQQAERKQTINSRTRFPKKTPKPATTCNRCEGSLDYEYLRLLEVKYHRLLYVIICILYEKIALIHREDR